MTIEKLASGSYRIKQMKDGKWYRKTIDHKPTKREAEELMQELIEQSATHAAKNMTFQKAAEGYLKMKSNVLSPSTIVGYDSITRSISESFMLLLINDIEMADIQNEINRLAADHKAKTVSNIHGFISAVLSAYRPQFRYRITLPAKQPVEYIIPTEDMVGQILEAAANTEYYVPFSLAVLSLRRSEVCALELTDLDGNILHVHRAKVEKLIDGKRRWIIKEYPKTADSNRRIYVPDEICEDVKSKGYFFKYTPKAILGKLNRIQDSLGFPHFRFHDFRHYYVSYAHMMGIPDKYIQAQGGWSTDHVMKRVYSHAFQEEYEQVSKDVAQTIIKDSKIHGVG